MGNTGYTCIRRTFCAFNIMIWLCSCIFFGLGLWLHLSYQGYASLLPGHAGLSADTVCMTIGVVSFAISFFGCCGSWFQSRCLLIFYFALVILLFLSEFLVGSLVFVFRDGVGRVLVSDLKQGIEKHYNNSDRGGLIAPSVSRIWDSLQTSLHCCGVSSYEDWYDISSWPGERWVPQSCCRPIQRDILEGSGDELLPVDCRKAGDPQLFWDKGCAQVAQTALVSNLHIVGIISLVIAFCQLFGLITSMLLFCTVKSKRESKTYKSYSPTLDTTLSRNGGTYLDD